jgi:hypothetical protein
LAVDGDFRRGIDAQTNLVSTDINDRDNNVIANHDAFIALSGEYEHRSSPS